MSNTSTTHQSRWGYHPCSYELFRKLQELHKWYWQTMYDFHRWHRWHRWFRKEPQNRVGEEPRYCTVFVRNTKWYRESERDGERHYKVYPKTVVDHDVCKLYNIARMPNAEPLDPFTDEQTAALLALHEQVAEDFMT